MDILFLAHHRQPKVGHHRPDNRILRQCASFLHIQTADGKNLIPVNQVALFIHSQTAVSVPVKGEPDIRSVLHNHFFEIIHVGGAAFIIDICAVRLVMDDAQACAQIKHGNGSRFIGCPVCAVQCNLDAVKFFGGCPCQKCNIII